MGKFIDLSGQRFGRWIVIEREGTDNSGCAKWKCKCDCGTERTVSGKTLRSGESRSCGCLHNEIRVEIGIRNKTHTNKKGVKNGKKEKKQD